jgi:DNA-directed RNA polymerase specialized sigma24 family protein
MDDFPQLDIPQDALIALNLWIEHCREYDRRRRAEQKTGVVEHTTPAEPAIEQLPAVYSETASGVRKRKR